MAISLFNKFNAFIDPDEDCNCHVKDQRRQDEKNDPEINIKKDQFPDHPAPFIFKHLKNNLLLICNDLCWPGLAGALFPQRLLYATVEKFLECHCLNGFRLQFVICPPIISMHQTEIELAQIHNPCHINQAANHIDNPPGEFFIRSPHVKPLNKSHSFPFTHIGPAH